MSRHVLATISKAVVIKWCQAQQTSRHTTLQGAATLNSTIIVLLSSIRVLLPIDHRSFIMTAVTIDIVI